MDAITQMKEPEGKYVYSVMFFFSPLQEQPHRRLFLFSSLAAIYDIFSADQIGCSLGHLYNKHVPDGETYQNDRCSIHRERVLSRKRQNG